MQTKPFEGYVNIYLQGKGALQPIDINIQDPFSYYVGSPASKILVKDFRKEPTDAAKLTLLGKSKSEFADVFNQPAMVSIDEKEYGVEIELKDCTEKGNFPTLWLGVIYDGKMPVHKITWEALIPIDDNATAFAILVND